MRTFTFLFILTFNSVLGQQIELINPDNFQGAIFPKNYELPYTENSSPEFRFTPSIQQIKEVDSLLKNRIKELNKDLLNQGDGFGPIIHKNFEKYARQYAGFINEQGEKIILINAIWTDYGNQFENLPEPWYKEWIIVLDGGSRYWHIYYNIDKKEFSNLYVNGVS